MAAANVSADATAGARITRRGYRRNEQVFALTADTGHVPPCCGAGMGKRLFALYHAACLVAGLRCLGIATKQPCFVVRRDFFALRI